MIELNAPLTFPKAYTGRFELLLCSLGLVLLECGKGDVEFHSRCLPLISPRMARFAVGAPRLRIGAPFPRPPPPVVVLLLGLST